MWKSFKRLLIYLNLMAEKATETDAINEAQVEAGIRAQKDKAGKANYANGQLAGQVALLKDQIRRQMQRKEELTSLLQAAANANDEANGAQYAEELANLESDIKENTNQLELVEATYLYSDGEGSHFLDQETFDTLTLSQEMMGYWLELRSTGMTYLDRAAPMRHLLTLWFGLQGRYLFHGAAVGEAGSGVLILGTGGAGKSTTALACLEAGMAYAGDDRCLLSMDELPYVHSLYGTAKLSDSSQFPSLATAIDMEGITSDEKAMYSLHRLSDSKLHSGFPLRAILLAHIEGIQETRISPASHARGFLALAASGALHLPEMRKQALRCFDFIARRLPVYDLKLGANIRSTPEAIRSLLRELH